MPKRIETSAEMLLSVESAYEQKSAEQMLQEIQQAIPPVEQALQQAIADQDESRINEFQTRLREYQKALITYQQAIPQEQAERERVEQRKREDLEDFGKSTFPKPPTRQKRRERGYTTPESLSPYVVKEPGEIAPEPEKAKAESESKKIRDKVKKRINEIAKPLKEQGVVDRDALIQAVMNDSKILSLDQSLRPSDEALTSTGEKGRPVSDPSDFEPGYFARPIVEEAVDEILKPEKRAPLYEDSLQKSYMQRMRTPSFLEEQTFLSEQQMFGTEDPNDEDAKLRQAQYREYVGKIGNDSPSNRALYQQFLDDFGALYRQKKKPEPSYETWLRDIRIKPYDDWVIQSDPQYQEFLLNEFEIAERSKKAPLTDREKRILHSNIGFDEFMNYLESQDEAQGKGERPSGVGLRALNAPPADLQKVRSPEAVENEIMQMAQSDGIATSEGDVAKLQGLAETLWVGEIENKIADLMTYDQDVKKQLRRASFRIRDVLNNVDPERRPGDMSVYGFEQALQANIKKGAGSWVKRYQKRMEDIEKDPSLKDPAIRENKEAVILSELKRWIVQKVYEATSNEVKRLARKRKSQDSLNDFMYDRQTDEQIRDIADPEDAFGTFEDAITAQDFNYDDMRKAGEYIANSKPSYRIIYDLLFNPQSDTYMGDIEPNRRQIQYAYNSVMDENYGGQGGVSVNSVSNIRSNFLRDVGDYIAEQEKDEGAAARGQKLRDQIGIRNPTRPKAEPKTKQPSKKQQKPTRQERMKDIRNLIAER